MRVRFFRPMAAAFLTLGLGGLAALPSPARTQSPPADAPMLRPQPHFADPAFGAELARIDLRVDDAYGPYVKSLRAAEAALAGARSAKIGSSRWRSARDAVRIAVREGNILSGLVNERIRLLERTLPLISSDEAGAVRELEKMSQSELLVTTDRMLSLLRALTRLDE